MKFAKDRPFADPEKAAPAFAPGRNGGGGGVSLLPHDFSGWPSSIICSRVFNG